MLIDSALDDDEFNIFLNLDFLNSSQKNEILTLNHIMLNKCNQSTIKKSINDKTIVFNEEFVLNLNMSDIDINFIFDENMINLNDLSFRSKTLIIRNPTLKEIYKNKLINDDHNLSNFINIDTSYFLDKDNLFFLIKNRRWLVEPWNHPALNKDLIAISSFLLLDITYNGIVDNNEPYSYRIMKYLKYLSIDTDLYDRELKQCNDIKKAILNVTNLNMIYESINILYDQPVFYQMYQVIREYNNKEVSLDHHIDFI